MDHVDAGHHLEQFAGHMRRAAAAGRGHVDLSRIGFGVRDKFRNGLRRNRWIDQHHHRHADDARHRRDVAHEIEFEIVVERGVDRVRDGGEQQRVAVGGGVDDRFGADIAAGAGAIFNHEGLPQMIGQPLADQARGDVDAAAGGKTGNNARRPRRIVEREGKPRQGGHGRDGRGEFKEIAAKKIHAGAPPVGDKAIPIAAT